MAQREGSVDNCNLLEARGCFLRENANLHIESCIWFLIIVDSRNVEMKTTVYAALIGLGLSGCVEPLAEYRPVVDPSMSSPAKFEKDLAACRAVATQAETEYKARQEKEMGQNLLAGLLVGAVAGAAVGGNSDWAATGAAYGAASGVAATDTELAVGGPRRIIDRCMTQRGHAILNDLGAG